MVTTKRCAHGTCQNDSRYPERWLRNSKGSPVTFHHFPGPIEELKKRTRWINACHRADSFRCTKDSYVCSLHFVGENGPTEDHPDPVSAIASKNRVSQMFMCFILSKTLAN